MYQISTRLSILLMCLLAPSVGHAAKVTFVNDSAHTVKIYISSTNTKLGPSKQITIKSKKPGDIDIKDNTIYRISVVYINEKNIESASFSPGNMRLTDGQNISVNSIDAFTQDKGAVAIAAKFDGTMVSNSSKTLSDSKWSSAFTVNGQRIPADIQFDGHRASYKTSSFTGSLRDIVYYKDNEDVLISGAWYTDGQHGGYFFFRVPANSPKTFSGKFSGNGGGTWSGSKK